MLVGRDEELDRVDRLLDAARAGESGSLVVSGEPGIGKTAILQAARERASDMTTLTVRGVESEVEIPFSGLLELVRSQLALVDLLPRPQARALRAALALGPEEDADRFAAYAGTLGLLAVAAEERPVLVLVDDAQWVDAASGEALAFAARRLGADRVAMLFSARAHEQLPFSLDGLEELPLQGLDAAAARRLLADVRHSAVDALVGATRGNPLALLELPRLLSAEQLRGSEPLEQPLAVGSAVQNAFGSRMQGLPAGTRTALLVAALSRSGEIGEVARALACAGVTPEALRPAEEAGVVAVANGRVQFRHPLVRAAVYSSASAPERRAAHRAIAEGLAGRDDRDEAVWHRALATLAPDESVAGALEAAAVRAQARSWQAAARAFERSAQLTPDAPARARRLYQAARAAERAGGLDRAERLVRAALAATDDFDLRTDADHLLGRVLAMRGDARAAADVLGEAARRVQDRDRAKAALILADAVEPSLADGLDRAEVVARTAWELASRGGASVDALVTLRYADVLAWLGDLKGATRLWLRAAETPADDPVALTNVAEALFSAGDDGRARSVAERAVDIAREQSAIGALPYALEVLALTETRSGRLREAADAAAEAVELATALGRSGERLAALGALAWAEALLGREEACRTHISEASELFGQVGSRPWSAGHGSAAGGLLALSLGEAEQAVEELEVKARAVGELISAQVSAARSFVPSLVEAYVRAGRRSEARRRLAVFQEAANRSERPSALAVAARCRGLVEQEEQHFLDALAWHERWENPFERARTMLCYGELLRRQRRRAEARKQLGAALRAFEEVGADIWAERAASELRATGVRARKRVPETAGDLTPQERHVARLVAEGLSNREIAARLFLSPKTVETHLRHIFQKLDVRSRTQVALALTASGDSSLEVQGSS